MNNLLLLIFSIIPQSGIRTETCYLLELNHIVSVEEDVWGGQPQIKVESYWLGRRDPLEHEVWIVDWWIKYGVEEVWNDKNYYYILLNKDNTFVLIRCKSVCVSITDYDIEARQRIKIEEMYEIDDREYRRGLLGKSR